MPALIISKSVESWRNYFMFGADAPDVYTHHHHHHHHYHHNHHHHYHHHHHLFLNREGRLGTKNDFATSFPHFPLFSTAPWDLARSRPVHYVMLSSHLFLCQYSLLTPFTVPCKMVLAIPDERETCPYHCSLRLFTMAGRTSCGLIACLVWHGLPHW